MLEAIRNAIRTASAVAEVPRKQAESFARELAKRGEVRASQVTAVAEDIVKRSRQNAEMVRTLITSEIRRQVKVLGLATKDDVEALKRKVRDLESRSRMAPPKVQRKPQRKPKPKPRTS